MELIQAFQQASTFIATLANEIKPLIQQNLSSMATCLTITVIVVQHKDGGYFGLYPYS